MGKKKISKKQLAYGYQYVVTVFGARNEVKDKQVVADAKKIATWIAKNNHILGTGAGHTGIMRIMTEIAYKAGGKTFGIGLHKYEPKPYKYLTDWEAFDSHSQRQNRLIEMSDAFIVMSGGLGTLMETIQVHIDQFLGETAAPLILVGEFGDYYKEIVSYFEKKGLLHKLPSDIRYCKNASEVIKQLDGFIAKKKKQNYFHKNYYPAIAPEDIYYHIKQHTDPYYILFEGIKMKVLPGVYPSNRFRSSKLLGEVVAKLSKGKKVADIACGHGTMGLVAALNGAKHVVQSDINPQAVESARQNIEMHKLENKIDLYEGDTFEPLAHRYKNYFDIIYFNPPFHRDAKHKNDKLMYAFYTQGTEGGVLDKFLIRAKYYLAPKGYIILGFSSKDHEANEFLKEAMKRYGYEWEYYLVTNQKTAADNIIYKIKPKKGEEEFKLADTKVRLGMILANTGLAKTDGVAMRQGVELAVKDLNREGVKVELGFVDDKSTYAGALKGVHEIIENFKPDAIIGPTWSYLIDVVTPILEEQGVTYFTPATTSDVLSTKGGLRISGAYNNDIKEDIISDFLKENKLKKLAYVHRGNEWAKRHQDIFEKSVNDSGGVYQGIYLEDAVGATEIKKIIKILKESKAQVCVIDNYEDIVGQLLQELKKAQLHIPVICTLALSKPVLRDIKKIQPSNALYIIDAQVPEAFIEKYYHEYKDEIAHRYAYNAYMGTMLLAQATRQKGKKSLREYILEDMKMNLFGESYSFLPNGDLRGSEWRLSRIEL